MPIFLMRHVFIKVSSGAKTVPSKIVRSVINLALSQLFSGCAVLVGGSDVKDAAT